MEEIIRGIIGRAVVSLDVDTLPTGGDFKEHGIDSLDVFAIISELQDSLEIEITDDDAEKCTSIESVMRLVSSLKPN
jgi:acyl carrier protein